MDYIQRIFESAVFLKQWLGEAEIGIVLGSGLGGFVTQLENSRSVEYADIPGFPVSTVPGHAGRFWIGTLQGKRVYMMQGRVRTYEGFEQEEVSLYVRVMKLLGVKTLIVTNAAGCVNLEWKPGDLMILNDFINFAGRNPLIGKHYEDFGARFPDMTHVYDRELIALCSRKAEELGVCVHQGVYMWFTGPCFETPAEIRMARILGADAVGMSTVPESIVAAQCGIRTLGISCLTNMAAGILDQPLTHEEVMETADRVKADFTRLLEAVVAEL